MEDLQFKTLNFCRICLQQNDNLSFIFTTTVIGVELHKIVMSLAPILILENDGLSEKVCADCQEKVATAYSLQQLCITSDKSQRDMLNLPAVEDVEMPYINVKNEYISDCDSEFDEQGFILETVETKLENESQSVDANSLEQVDEVNEEGKIKKYSCKVCDKIFLQQSQLSRHLIAHRSDHDLGGEAVLIKQEELDPTFVDEDEINNLVSISKQPRLNKGRTLRKCPLCGKLFDKVSNLRKHLNSSVHRPKYNCDKCPLKFTKILDLNEHITVVHYSKEEMTQNEFEKANEQLVKLEQPTTSTSNESLQEIVDKEEMDFEKLIADATKFKGRTKHPCKLCGKVFKNITNLARHVNSSVHNTSLKPFPCPKCPQRFSTEQLLSRHAIIHSDLITPPLVPEKFICIVCSQEFPSQETKTAHLKTHKQELKEMDFQCDLCPKIFKKLVDFTRHSKTHMENRQHKCNVCNKLFARGSSLIDHLNLHKGLRPHQCDICQKSFQHKNTLKNHLITHTDEKPYCCDKCGRSFNTSSNFQQHVKRHSEAKNFSCKLCPLKFYVKGDLTSHMVTHGGGKNWSCEICGSSFTQSWSLKQHKKKHSGLRPYECETCLKKFITPDHLKRHIRIHTGEKPYICEYCNRAFTQRNDMLKHTRIHIGETTYKCEICNEGFKLQKMLKEHWRTHEGQFENLPGPSKVEKGEIRPAMSNTLNQI